MDSSKSDLSCANTEKCSTLNEAKNLKEEKRTQKDEIIEKEKIKQQATLLFLQGKRSVFIRDFQGAIAALSESCQLFKQIYPEQDEALADPYFFYGKALLEIGRNESEVLGDQMQDSDKAKSDDDEDDDDNDDDEDDEDNNDDEEEEEAKEENNVGGNDNNEKTNSKVNSNGTISEENELIKNKESADSSTIDKENLNTTVGNNESENEEINDLQLSWEYLELAKLIYLKKSSTCKDTAIKLAETYLCLGENGLESENYSVAIEDIKQALELQKAHLPEIDRRIAETYYQLGVAYSLSQNHDDAIASFTLAIEHLKKKILSLEKRKEMGDKKTAEEEKDAFYTMDGEIKEIQTLIKEVEEKIKDMHEFKNHVKEELLKQVVSAENPSGSSSFNTSHSSSSMDIQATDISHLIKKKRKNDEEDPTIAEKKTKLE